MTDPNEQTLSCVDAVGKSIRPPRERLSVRNPSVADSRCYKQVVTTPMSNAWQ